MKFTRITKNKARLRQKSRCAVCGDNLDWQMEHAHHIHPHADGGINHVDNCAVVCENCHLRVHNDGNFKSLIVAPANYFRYLNGKYERRISKNNL